MAVGIVERCHCREVKITVQMYGLSGKTSKRGHIRERAITGGSTGLMGPLQLGSRDHNFPKNLLYYGL